MIIYIFLYVISLYMYILCMMIMYYIVYICSWSYQTHNIYMFRDHIVIISWFAAYSIAGKSHKHTHIIQYIHIICYLLYCFLIRNIYSGSVIYNTHVPNLTAYHVQPKNIRLGAMVTSLLSLLLVLLVLFVLLLLFRKKYKILTISGTFILHS